jgi:hypothetical protein
MTVEEALAEAATFLQEYAVGDFASLDGFVAAAMLKGEHVGIRRMRAVMSAALEDANTALYSVTA